MAHILIIEDYRDIRDVTELILADAGHTVVSAGDGVRGLDIAACDQPDLILMDLVLPFLDGWEATRRLKANPTTRHIPVVALTARVAEEEISSAFAVGCVALIAKPFELETLLSEVEAVLSRHRSAGWERSIGAG